MAASGVGRKLLLVPASPAVADDVDVADDVNARRIRTVLDQMRVQDRHDVGAGDDRRSTLDELRSFSNTLNGLDLPVTASQHDRHQQLSYAERLMQVRGDLTLLEQLVSQTFHWRPQQSAVSDSKSSHVVDQTQQVHPVHSFTVLRVYYFHAVLGFCCSLFIELFYLSISYVVLVSGNYHSCKINDKDDEDVQQCQA